MKKHFDIAVVGGGITGLLFAALVASGEAREQVSLTLIDASPRPQFDSDNDLSLRVSAIANGSADIFDSVGAWQHVTSERLSPYDGMRVWDESDEPDGASTLRFDAAEFATPQLGFIVENVLLQHALLRVLDDLDVDLQFDTRLESLPDADLVVGADGARSFVRKLAGIESSLWPYEQTAVVTHVKPEKTHGGVARQRFLRDGPLGMLPLADGRLSVVWSTTPDTAEAAISADESELGARLTDASDGVLGELVVAGPKGAFPLAAQHAHHYVLPGLALIGDAAHAIHPLAGQGANLGIQDAAELADVICTAIRDGLHPGDRPVLRRYERARKGANLTMMHFMTGLNRLFATDSELVGDLRTVGMRAFNQSGPIRERAVKVALGVV
ncbi:MAG: UbiH/UbiF/VisC/COQ6 family ubiquinone biosynthesis hydroxylase [Pseudomonadota bacterium]